MQSILDLIKKILPKAVLKKIRPLGHGFLAYCAAIYYSFPAEQMLVVGITGTAGKSTTAQMLAAILNSAGKKTGYTTTISHSDGDVEHINKVGLSMPGRFMLQKYLSEMLKNGCEYVIVECTSEGLAQNRHLGVNFDLALLTNISEAHLDAHGSFGNYVQAKKKLFTTTVQGKKKKLSFEIDSKPTTIQKTLGINLFSKPATEKHPNFIIEDFLNFDKVSRFVVQNNIVEENVRLRKLFYKFVNGEAENKAEEIIADKTFTCNSLSELGESTIFEMNGQKFTVNLPGSFNAENAMLASATANILGVDLQKTAAALATFHGSRGRMQEISNDKGIKILIDYAPEPEEMRQALATAEKMPHQSIIHVFGSTGGHRDVAKRFEFGKLSAAIADSIIITNDDVYDSDPEEIAANIRSAIEQTEAKPNKVYTILDRKEAIKKAIEIARAGDIILFTGKGSEQFLVLPNNKRIAWDEAKIIRELL